MSVKTENNSQSRPLPVAEPLYRVFIRDLIVPCTIGIHDHEKEAAQRVRLNIDLSVREYGGPLDDNYEHVVCYEKIADSIRELIDRGHVNLVETLAEDIAAICLKKNRVRSARIRVEKLDILADAVSVGVEIERFKITDE